MVRTGIKQTEKENDRARTEWIKEPTTTAQSKELSLHRLEKMRKGLMKPDRIVGVQAKGRAVGILRTV
jgi:hypothetical protein